MPTQTPQQRLNSILTIVSTWDISKALLASKLGITPYTLRMKINKKPNYTFTDLEIEKLGEALQELSHEIEKVCGISFNKALAKIARKKV